MRPPLSAWDVTSFFCLGYPPRVYFCWRRPVSRSRWRTRSPRCITPVRLLPVCRSAPHSRCRTARPAGPCCAPPSASRRARPRGTREPVRVSARSPAVRARRRDRPADRRDTPTILLSGRPVRPVAAPQVRSRLSPISRRLGLPDQRPKDAHPCRRRSAGTPPVWSLMPHRRWPVRVRTCCDVLHTARGPVWPTRILMVPRISGLSRGPHSPWVGHRIRPCCQAPGRTLLCRVVRSDGSIRPCERRRRFGRHRNEVSLAFASPEVRPKSLDCCHVRPSPLRAEVGDDEAAAAADHHVVLRRR